MKTVSKTTFNRMTPEQRQHYHRTRQKINLTRATLCTAMGEKLRAETRLEHMTQDHFGTLESYEAMVDQLTAQIETADLNANWARDELKRLNRYYHQLIEDLENEYTTTPDFKTLICHPNTGRLYGSLYRYKNAQTAINGPNAKDFRYVDDYMIEELREKFGDLPTRPGEYIEHITPYLMATYPPDPDADLEQRIQAQKDRDGQK